MTAEDPGGLAASQIFTVTVDDRNGSDHSDTPAGATTVTLDTPFSGRIDSPADVDYFRIRIDTPGELTIQTTGDANPDIAVFDAEGLEVPGMPGSWIVNITLTILNKGNFLHIRISGGNPGHDYFGNITFREDTGQSWGAVDTIPPQTLARMSSVSIIHLDLYFSYPQATDLRFNAEASDPSLVQIQFPVPGGPVFALFSNSNLGSTEVTVTATDPRGQTAFQTFMVSVENRAPVTAKKFPTVETLNLIGEIDEDVRFDLDAYFSDPDGDELSYTVNSSSPGAVSAKVIKSSHVNLFNILIEDNILELTGVQTARDSLITVTADDPYNLSAEQIITVKVYNHAPHVSDTFPNPFVVNVEVCKSTTIDLSGLFSDPDGDEIAYGYPPDYYISSFPVDLYDEVDKYHVATANIIGSTLTIKSISSGYTILSIPAYNPHAYEGGNSPLFLPYGPI